MATNTPWNSGEWNLGTWNGLGVDVVVKIGDEAGWGSGAWEAGAWSENSYAFPLSLKFVAPNQNAWNEDVWSADDWNGGVTVNVFGNANIVPTAQQLNVSTNSLDFVTNANFAVTTNNLTISLDDVTTVAEANIVPATNLLQLAVQSPSISADGFTEAVIGEELGFSVNSITVNHNAIPTFDGSEVSISVGGVIIEGGLELNVTGSGVTLTSGDIGISSDANVNTFAGSIINPRSGSPTILGEAFVVPIGSTIQTAVGTVNVAAVYHVIGSEISTETGTLGFSTDQVIEVTGNNLTLGSGDLIITIWEPIVPGANQPWTAITTGATQTWTPISTGANQTWTDI